MYDQGLGVTKDLKIAFEWFYKAAKQGNLRAQYNVALSYLRGSGVPEDEREAFRWFSRAAYQGDPDAQNALGTMYANGRGVMQDFIGAHIWFILSAEQGNPSGISNRNASSRRIHPDKVEFAERMARRIRENIANTPR